MQSQFCLLKSPILSKNSATIDVVIADIDDNHRPFAVFRELKQRLISQSDEQSGGKTRGSRMDLSNDRRGHRVLWFSGKKIPRPPL